MGTGRIRRCGLHVGGVLGRAEVQWCESWMEVKKRLPTSQHKRMKSVGRTQSLLEMATGEGVPRGEPALRVKMNGKFPEEAEDGGILHLTDCGFKRNSGSSQRSREH